MALSLSGEQSVTAGSHANPVRALFAWFAQTKANRRRRAVLLSLLEMDAARLSDLGITAADISDAMDARNGRTSGMVLQAARARNALR